MAVWGYARISTDEVRQHIDRQFRELEKMGVVSESLGTKQRQVLVSIDELEDLLNSF